MLRQRRSAPFSFTPIPATASKRHKIISLNAAADDDSSSKEQRSSQDIEESVVNGNSGGIESDNSGATNSISISTLLATTEEQGNESIQNSLSKNDIRLLSQDPEQQSPTVYSNDKVIIDNNSNNSFNSNTNWNYWGTAHELSQAACTGVLTGFLVAMFKLVIEAVRNVFYEQDVLVPYPWLIAGIPALGGAVVGLLLLAGGPMPPGLRGTVQDVDDQSTKQNNLSWNDQLRIQGNFWRKSSAAIMTLGTGCSLGPEGPCVEIGMNVARACTMFNQQQKQQPPDSPTISDVEEQYFGNDTDTYIQQQQQQRRGWNRILLSCGASAGVAAGFNAPIAGVFFALEIMQGAFSAMDQTYQQQQQQNNGSSNTATSSSMTTTTTITPILISSVLSALVAQAFLGDQLVLVLTQFSLKTPLIELPLYLLLGALSGVTAFCFSYSAKISQQVFDGDFGPQGLQTSMKSLPNAVKPIIGGLLCGVVGLAFPQILFFGYETLNSLLKNNSLPLSLILSLLGVKTLMTAISAGSGLVGGTFAPSLFLGAMLGAGFHELAADGIQAFNNFELVSSSGHSMDAYTFGYSSMIVTNAQINVPQLQLAGTPAYAMVGAASVLAALFRAPLTASLLLFEVTRNYDIILPLMVSAGIGSIISDILEDTFERRDEMSRRDLDPVSWGDLADADDKTKKDLKKRLLSPLTAVQMDQNNED